MQNAAIESSALGALPLFWPEAMLSAAPNWITQSLLHRLFVLVESPMQRAVRHPGTGSPFRKPQRLACVGVALGGVAIAHGCTG